MKSAIAFLAVTQAVSLSQDGYIKTRDPLTIGSRWGLKPTKTWIAGPYGDHDPELAKAEARQKDQEWHMAVDSIHQNGDFAQVASEGAVDPLTVGTQWGLKPTQTWIAGPGPASDIHQQEAEERQKKAEGFRSVDSIFQGGVAAQVAHISTDNLIDSILENGMTPVKYDDEKRIY